LAKLSARLTDHWLRLPAQAATSIGRATIAPDRLRREPDDARGP
jgi:hypothetical protein